MLQNNAKSAFLLALSLAAASAQAGTGPSYPPLTDQVELPRDEAPHHNSTEWWYFNGHLAGKDDTGKEHDYGYSLTIFQIIPVAGAPFAVYMAQFAITDESGKTYHYGEKIALSVVPNEHDGFDLGVNGWRAEGSSGNYAVAATLADGTYSLSLDLKSTIAPALNGKNGIIPYGPYGTSAYYSYTALDASGTIIDHGRRVKVTGISWQDRQWGNFAQTQAGWNWFAIQLNDNVQYMLYFIQDSTGAVVQKLGTQVVDGKAILLSPDQIAMTPTATWTSPKSGYTYPSQWLVTVPDGSFTVTPVQQDQELYLPGQHTYFEGDCTISGTLNGNAATGLGYTEVNPYFESSSGL